MATLVDSGHLWSQQVRTRPGVGVADSAIGCRVFHFLADDRYLATQHERWACNHLSPVVSMSLCGRTSRHILSELEANSGPSRRWKTPHVMARCGSARCP